MVSVTEQLRAGGSELDLAPDLLEEAQSDIGVQQLYLLRYRGLGQVQLARRALLPCE